eukprot:gene5181-5419_t
MINVDFASPSLVLGIALIGCGVALLQVRNMQREVSRDADIVVAAMISIVGSTLIFQGWRLDPLLLLCQALTTSVAFWYGLETFKLRSQVIEEDEGEGPLQQAQLGQIVTAAKLKAAANPADTNHAVVPAPPGHRILTSPDFAQCDGRIVVTTKLLKKFSVVDLYIGTVSAQHEEIAADDDWYSAEVLLPGAAEYVVFNVPESSRRTSIAEACDVRVIDWLPDVGIDKHAIQASTSVGGQLSPAAAGAKINSRLKRLKDVEATSSSDVSTHSERRFDNKLGYKGGDVRRVATVGVALNVTAVLQGLPALAV